jgi:hypothetical protein
MLTSPKPFSLRYATKILQVILISDKCVTVIIHIIVHDLTISWKTQIVKFLDAYFLSLSFYVTLSLSVTSFFIDPAVYPP